MNASPQPVTLTATPVPAAGPATVAVVGLGYVGLPTSLALDRAGHPVIGLDASPRRLREIRDRRVDVLPAERARLDEALGRERYRLTGDSAELADADAVVICVPTPVDEERRPDLSILEAACATVVAHARRGQTVVLASTTSVGSTRRLLVDPLRRRGLRAGREVHVAFAPERIDPGNVAHEQTSVARVVGGVTLACAEAAARVLEPTCSALHVVSSPEAAELTKLYENTFRAVNIALANEVADACGALGLDPIEVTRAAATKPYGYMPFLPGAGVGGHCIPCDPHYLAAPLRAMGSPMTLVETAMDAIARRPHQVVDRAAELLAETGRGLDGARVLVVGAAYKPGIQDVRESPALEVLAELLRRRGRVEYHDPLVPSLRLGDGLGLLCTHAPEVAAYDLVVVLTVHPGHDYGWLDRCGLVLDATFRAAGGARRAVV